MIKTVYLHDENGLFTSAYDCQESPLEPGVFIEPIDSLPVAPPRADGFWPVATDGAWLNVRDYRGQTIYCLETREPKIVTELGEIPDGYSLEQPPAPEPTLEEIISSYVSAVQSHLDATARQRGYDSILSACTYATSTNQKFAAEGQACVAWRDQVWTTCHDKLDAVQSGDTKPTIDELISELPPMQWPD